MKITALKIDNFKRISAVHLDDLGDIVTLSGRNAQGKSSVIDGIWTTLAGLKGAKVVRPIKEGAKRAKVELELTDMEGDGDGATLVVTREWKGERSTITVKPKGSRAPLAKPQDVLDSLIGMFSFDPLHFVGMKPQDQLSTLLGIVKLDFDPVANETKRKEAYDLRTATNRMLKQQQGALEEFDDAVEASPVVVLDIVERIREVEESERNIEEVREQYIAAKKRVAQLKVELEQSEDWLLRLGRRGAELKAKNEGLPDLADLQSQLARAAEINAEAARWSRRVELQRTVDGYQADSDELTAEIERLKQEKSDGLARAKFPIEGLGFDDDGVTYLGAPLWDSSQAEKIKVGMAIAMALNPAVRVVCVKDASVIDRENLQLIHDLAAEKDYQLFLELVDRDEDATVVIEDGVVA